MIFTKDIITKMEAAKYGNRSYTKQLLVQIKEQNKQQEVADAILEVLAFGISNAIPLTAICRKIANRVYRIMDIKQEQNDRVTIRLGADAVDWASQAELVTAEKFAIADNEGQEQYFLMPLDDDFITYINENATGSLKANNGYTPWENPTLTVGEHRLDIVKSARRHNLLSLYRYSEMPEVYRCLNKLHSTKWNVNKDMLDLLSSGLHKPAVSLGNLIPGLITDPERKEALRMINKTERTALWIKEVQFKQLMDNNFNEEAADKIADFKANEYKKEKQEDHLDVISMWSKRMDFERCIKLATEYKEDDLNFIYNCDSRGRVYALQTSLNPQGADFAKSLLCFADPKPVSTYDLMVTIANHAGQDKKSYDDRVKWVQNNQEMIYLIGTDTYNPIVIEWFKSTGIIREDKSKFQFIAACIEYAKLMNWIADGNNQDDFLCSIPVAYDATNSGLQILSALGRDEIVAPLVNITETDKPGDVYQYIGDKAAKVNTIEPLKEFKPGMKIWRKIAKRNVMTKSYAATRIGMGDQQWEDRKTYGSTITDNLTVKECSKLGALIYDTCEEHLPRAAQLMNCMKKAVKDTTSSIVKWKLPNGFTAFQVKDKSKKDKVNVKIGKNDRIQLTFYTYTGIPNKVKHQFAIAPDMVHSLDALLLCGIVNDMPEDANLAFVHDQYGSDSCYGEEIQNVAKHNYYDITSRTVLKLLLEQVANDEIELPEAGNWNPKELLKAAYLVC